MHTKDTSAIQCVIRDQDRRFPHSVPNTLLCALIALALKQVKQNLPDLSIRSAYRPHFPHLELLLISFPACSTHTEMMVTNRMIPWLFSL